MTGAVQLRTVILANNWTLAFKLAFVVDLFVPKGTPTRGALVGAAGDRRGSAANNHPS